MVGALRLSHIHYSGAISNKPKSGKRRYDGRSRQAAAAGTRERICNAAEAGFLRDGYARTSIRAVAGAAGVAERTVYLSYPNKPALLDAVILRAIRASGAEGLGTILAAPAVELLPRLAKANAALMARAARLIALGEAASLMDAELRPFRERAHESLRTAYAQIAASLGRAGLLRVEEGEAAATLYAIANESTYLRMTESAQMTLGRYSDWLEETLLALLGTEGSSPFTRVHPRGG